MSNRRIFTPRLRGERSDASASVWMGKCTSFWREKKAKKSQQKLVEKENTQKEDIFPMFCAVLVIYFRWN